MTVEARIDVLILNVQRLSDKIDHLERAQGSLDSNLEKVEETLKDKIDSTEAAINKRLDGITGATDGAAPGPLSLATFNLRTTANEASIEQLKRIAYTGWLAAIALAAALIKILI